MDLDVAALATSAAGTLVTLMTTAGWEKAAATVGALWRRERPQQADLVVADLRDTRAELLDARPDELPELHEAITAQWEARILRLLTKNPEAGRALLEFIDDQAASVQGARPVTFNAVSHGQSKIYQSNGNMVIGE